MNKPDVGFCMNDQRKIMRLLKFLHRAPACFEASFENDQQLLTSEDGGAIAVDRLILETLLGCAAVLIEGNRLTITGCGRGLLHEVKGLTETGIVFNEGNWSDDVDVQKMHIDGHWQAVIVNSAESPLAMLYRLNKQTGKRFLSDEEFLAGERLRADFTRGNMLPSITANWTAWNTKRLRGQRGGAAELSDHAIDCRARVDKALKAVGPELSGVLLDICCFLKGLELVERERSWPVRSAKILLKTALSILHRHYTHGHGAENTCVHAPFHWGAPDYQPAI